MANVNSVEYAAELAGFTTLTPAQSRGKVRFIKATVDADLAQNDVLICPSLPAGAAVLFQRVSHTMGVASLTYAVAVNDGSARTIQAATAATNDDPGSLHASQYTAPLAAKATPTVTFAAANPPADGTFEIEIFYSVD